MIIRLNQQPQNTHTPPSFILPLSSHFQKKSLSYTRPLPTHPTLLIPPLLPPPTPSSLPLTPLLLSPPLLKRILASPIPTQHQSRRRTQARKNDISDNRACARSKECVARFMRFLVGLVVREGFVRFVAPGVGVVVARGRTITGAVAVVGVVGAVSRA